jgi:hypothetical protein
MVKNARENVFMFEAAFGEQAMGKTCF